jgi:hypothetical protein
MFGFGRRIRRTSPTTFALKLPDDERAILRNVVPQLGELLSGDLADPSLRRLFPTAYAQDPERDREYHALVRDELADRRRASVELVLATVDATELTEEQLTAWMHAVNDLRLVLGTRLDVSEDTEPEPDPDDPEGPLLVLYGYLGYLLDSIVTALAE